VPANRYQLRTSDGGDVGEEEFSWNPQPGDEIRFDGNRRARVLSVIPVELAGEFADGALYGALEIESMSG
jgi:hypothetical protein